MVPHRLKPPARRLLAALHACFNAPLDRIRHRVIILTYHRVLTRQELATQIVQPGMYVAADVFEQHMRFLLQHFRIISLLDLLRAWDRGGLPDDRPHCIVTFDDGWLDNYTHAYPILRRLGIPATMFLPTSYVGTRRWFWPDRLGHLLHVARAQTPSRLSPRWRTDLERVIRAWKRATGESIERDLRELALRLGVAEPSERRIVDWDEVAEMAAHGISFGSHSATHAILTATDAQQLETEVGESLAVLRERAKNWIPVFAYPNGTYSEAVVQRVEAAGYVAAVTTDPGAETGAARDRFRIRRIGVHDDISRTPALFSFHLSRSVRVPASQG